MPAAYHTQDLATALRPCLREVLEVLLVVQTQGDHVPRLSVAKAIDDLSEALRVLDTITEKST